MLGKCRFVLSREHVYLWIQFLEVLTCPVDLNFPVEAEFVFSDFLLIPLAPGMNRKFIVHIFSISS